MGRVVLGLTFWDKKEKGVFGTCQAVHRNVEKDEESGYFFGNSSKIMLTNCLDKHSSQTPISPAATLTPGARLCGHCISHDVEAVYHPQRLPVTGSSTLHCLHAGTQADRSQYLEFYHSLWQRELALESLLPAALNTRARSQTLISALKTSHLSSTQRQGSQQE